LQTSTRPEVALHAVRFVPPETMRVSSTDDCDQSLDAVVSRLLQAEVVLFPRSIVNGLDVRAQWYLPHEWLAEAEPARAVAATAASAARTTSFFNGAPL
jgi:hypothetical protein